MATEIYDVRDKFEFALDPDLKLELIGHHVGVSHHRVVIPRWTQLFVLDRPGGPMQ